MQSWFQAHLDVVFFVYGLAFISMGTAVAVYVRFKSSFRIAQPLIFLVFFGISHGINEWLMMFALLKGSTPILQAACFFTLAVSYLFLFEFGRRLNVLHIAAAPAWLKRLEQRNGAWLTVALLCAVLVIAFSSQNILLTGTVLARYCLGFPGAALSATGMVLYYRSEEDLLEPLGTKKYFYGGVAAFLFYAIFGGLVVPPAPFFPADVLNNDTFSALVHVPAEVFRTLCAVVIAWSVTGILKIFHWERSRDEQRSQEEIKTLKQQMEFIIGATSTGLDIIDADYNVRYVDPAWKKVYGEYEGKKCHDYFMRRPAPCEGCGVKKALETKQIAVTEEFLVKEGNRPIQVTTIPFKDVNGEWLVAEVNVDISERKKGEDRLRESEERYRTLIENVGIGVAMISPRMEVLTINNQMKEWFPAVDAAKRPICYKSFSVPPRDTMCEYCPARLTLADGKVHEAVAETPAGDTVRNFRIVSTPLFGEKGEVKAAIEMVEDITARRQSEKKLELFRSLLDQSNDAIYIIEPEMGRFLDVNQSACTMLGYTREELLTMSVKDMEAVIPDSPAWKRHVEEVRGKGYVFLEGEHIRKDGSTCPVDVNVKYIEQEGKAFMVAVVRDITERKRAEEAIRDREDTYRALVETTDTGFLILDSQGRVLGANAEYVRLSGYQDLKEILGRSVTEWTAPRMRERNKEAVARCVRDRRIRSLEIEYVWPNGSIIPVEINATVQGDGASLRIISLCRDITERKKAEDALKASERKTRAILDQSFGFIGLMTTGGMLVEANRTALEFAGIDELDVFGKPFWETPWWTHSAELQERLRQSVRRAAQGEFDRFEATHTAADGSLHYVDFSLSPVKDDSGKVVFMIPEGRDITEQRQAQESLRKSEAKYHDLVETARSIILMLDCDHNILFLNKYGEEFFGYAAREVLGKDVLGTIVPDKDAAGRDLRSFVAGVFTNPEAHSVQENENIKKNGERVWISWANRALYDEAGRPAGFLSVGTDITARRQAEESLRKAYADLQEMQNTLIQSEKLAALGRFSLGVAHEIKNPLGIILGGIEYLDIKMPDLPGELKETMKKVEDATVRADRIVHTLLRFARPADLKMEKIRPEDLISETITFLKYRAPVSNIKVVKKFMKEKLFVNVDKNQIQQVLFNLLVNAVDAMPPEGGEICVKTYKSAHEGFSDKPACVIEVSDTGSGISREHLKRMFEPFFTTKRDKKGTGLGLPVSKTIINNHKGEMAIESEEGKGTTVRIILPIAE
jgi:PAS domain S-box-containing protein